MGHLKAGDGETNGRPQEAGKARGRNGRGKNGEYSVKRLIRGGGPVTATFNPPRSLANNRGGGLPFTHMDKG